MFDFELSEELSLLQRTAEDFGRQALWPALRSAEQQRGVSAQVLAAHRAIGLDALELPEALGGAGLGALARVLGNEALGAADAGAALALDRLGPALYALRELGGEDAVRRHAVPRLQASAGGRVALVTAAEAGLHVHGDRVSGQIPWIPADELALLVVLGDDHALLVTEGLTLEPLRGAGLRAAGAASVTLAHAPILERLSGRAGAADAARALARGRLYVASLLLGVLRQATEYGRAYAQEREAFGKKIAHHQALAFMITDLAMAVEGVRLLVHDAALRADGGLPFEAAAASAWVETIEAARVIGPAAVQLLGGHGFMQDHPAEKFMREARALGLLLSGIDAARETAGRALCAQSAPIQLSAGGA